MLYSKGRMYNLLVLCNILVHLSEVVDAEQQDEDAMGNHSDSKDWQIFLNSLYSKFTTYEILKWSHTNGRMYYMSHEKSQEIITDRHSFRNFISRIAQYDIAGLGDIKDIEITKLQLEELNRILNSIIRIDLEIDDGSWIARGNFLKLTDVLEPLNLKVALTGWKGNNLHLKIFAFDTIFIDTDIIIPAGFQLSILSIIAPKWEIIGKRKFTLDGHRGKSPDPARAKTGENGKPGLPGTDGYNFFGIGKQFINGMNLTITSNAGAGGHGQHGGHGESGIINDNYSYTFIKESGEYTDCMTQSLDLLGPKGFPEETIYYSNKYPNFLQFSVDRQGLAGKDGGDGGKGGSAGEPGNVILIDMDNSSEIIKINKSARNGDDGLGGKGGKGGLINQFFQCECFTIKNCSILKENDIHPSGKDGKDGANFDFKKVLKRPSLTSSMIINEYKRYSLRILKDQFDKSTTLHFLYNLYNHENVNRMYVNVSELLIDLQNLEDQFPTLGNEIDFLPFYESFPNRIIILAEHSEQVQNSIQYRKLLTYAYTATLGRIYNLKGHLKSNLIINIAEYLDTVKESFESLKTLRDKNDEFIATLNKLKTIDKYRNDFKGNIDKKIEEAMSFIKKEIEPEIDAIGAEIDRQIDFLVKEVAKMEEKAEENKKELIKTQRKLEDQMVAKGIFGFLKVLGSVIIFFGPVGAVIGSGIVAATSISESLALNGDISYPALQKLPNGIKMVENEMKTMRDKKIDHLNKILKYIDAKENEGNKNINDVEKKIVSIKEELKKTDDLKKIRVLENEIPKELKRIKNEIIKEKDIMNEKTKKTLNTIDKCQKFFTLTTEIVDVVNQYKSDQKHFNTVNNAINQQEIILQRLKEYEDHIHEVIVPTIQNMKDNLNKTSEQLEEKSRVALHLTKWKVQSSLKDIKLKMQEATQGFQMQNNLARVIKKLEEGMTILIDVYDHIQNYQEQQTLANYYADISLTIVGDIKVTDANLTMMANKLEKTMSSNLVLQQYQIAVDAFKQFAFPFADYYFEGITLPKYMKSIQNDTDLLVSEAARQIIHLKSKLNSYRNSIRDHDGCIGYGEFNSQYSATLPFFVWKNDQHKSMISKLLAGQEIFVNADIKESLTYQNAIKFNVVDLNFKTKNATSQITINKVLEKFKITMTHTGDSHYRYKDKYYKLFTASQKIYYYFQKKQCNQEPVHTGGAYEKIKKGDFMLSPYALWKLKLSKVVNGTSFDDLKVYEDEIDLELNGSGYYINDEEDGCSDLIVDKYYETDGILKNSNRIKRSIAFGKKNFVQKFGSWVNYKQVDRKALTIGKYITNGTA